MRLTSFTAIVLLVLMAVPSAAAAGQLRMEFQDGLVSISAADVPLRQVLSEWGRLGRTRIVNLEKISGAPLTLELARVPEKQALEIVLRGVQGYVVAQRAAALPGSSQFDRIVVMPGSVPPPSRAAAAPQPAPMQPQPQQMPAAMVDDQDQPVQEAPEQVEAAEQQQQPPPQQPQLLTQPGIQPMPPNAQGQNQNEPPSAVPPGGRVLVPSTGAVVAPAPGQLPVPAQKPPQQQQ